MTQRIGETRDQYNERRRLSYATNPREKARINAENRRSYVRHRKQRVLSARAYRAAYPHIHRRCNRKKQGVLDLVGDETRFGACPICAEEKNLVPDHDHVTGKMRGWICARCNLLLGVYEKWGPKFQLYLEGFVAP